jgi:hypothetical protein
MTGAPVRHKKMKNGWLYVVSLACTSALAREAARPHVADFMRFFIGAPVLALLASI